MKNKELDGEMVLIRDKLRLKAYEITHSFNTKIPFNPETDPFARIICEFAQTPRGQELLRQQHAYLEQLIKEHENDC